MLYATIFVCVSLLCTLLFAHFVSAGALWAPLIFVLSFLLCHALYVLRFFLACGPQDQSRPIEKQNPTARRGCAGAAGFLCAYGGLKVRIHGREKLPRDRRFLFVCNHRSLFDPLIVMDKLRDYNISFISKPSNLAIPLAGDVAYAAGYLAIDRENDRKALKTILTAADYMKRDLCSVGIYPEGTRSHTEEMLPFHPGSFKLAQRAGAPLVIACVRGTGEIHKHPLRLPKIVDLDILAVLEPEQVKAMSTSELSDYSRRLIQDCLDGKISGEEAQAL